MCRCSSSREPAPPGVPGSHRTDRSGAGKVDGDGDGVADDVADGRVAGEAGEFGELIVIEIAGGLDRDLDLLVARADMCEVSSAIHWLE